MDTNNQNDWSPESIGAKPAADAWSPTSIGAKPYNPQSDPNDSAALLGVTNTLNENHQNMLDAQQNADYQNSPQGITMNTIQGLPQAGAKTFLDPAVKFVRSAIQAPIDIVRSLFGKKPIDTKLPLPSGEMSGSIQSDFADKANQVYEGNMTPLQATAGTVGETVGGGADLLGGEQVIRGAAKLASPVVNAIGDKLAERASQTATKKAIDIVSPRLTPKVAESATTQTSLLRGKITAVPDERTTQIADAVKDVVQGKSFSADKELVKNALSKEAETLKNSVKSSDHLVPKKELKSVLRNSERPVLISSDKTLNNAYDKVLNKTSEIIDKMDGTVSGALDGRKTFDQFVEKQFPNLYNSDAMTPMRTAIKDIRMNWNDFVAKQVPDIAFKDSLKKQNLMYEAIDNLSEKAARGAPKIQGEIGTTRLQRFADKHPTATKVAKWGGGITVGAVGAGEVAKHAP